MSIWYISSFCLKKYLHLNLYKLFYALNSIKNYYENSVNQENLKRFVDETKTLNLVILCICDNLRFYPTTQIMANYDNYPESLFYYSLFFFLFPSLTYYTLPFFLYTSLVIFFS